MTDLRLIIFDVDGTLVDSQHVIVDAMARAFTAEGLTPPPRADVLSIVGLSLGEAIAALAPDLPRAQAARVVEGYKAGFADARAEGAKPALYPGTTEMLTRVGAHEGTLLGIATGKSRRGVDHMITAHGFEGRFSTIQCADNHPSKPHPSMIETALAETGVDAAQAVMIGDTRFDMQMARAARVPFIGVDWGYHAASTLDDAVAVLTDWDGLPDALSQLWGQS